MPTAIGSRLGLREQDEGNDELRPAEDGVQDEGRGETGQAQGQHHPHEGAEAGAAVDHRRVLKALRDAVEEALEHPGEERGCDRDVEDGGAEVAVGQADPVHVAVERHHDDEGRDHLEAEEPDHGEVAVAELEPRQRVGGRRREEHGAERAGHGELQAVPEVGREQRVAERGGVVFERRVLRPEPDVAHVDLGRGADRERHQPEQRPGEEQADHAVGEVGAEVGEAGAAGDGHGALQPSFGKRRT